jgi:hypothetical protein
MSGVCVAATETYSMAQRVAEVGVFLIIGLLFYYYYSNLID